VDGCEEKTGAALDKESDNALLEGGGKHKTRRWGTCCLVNAVFKHATKAVN